MGLVHHAGLSFTIIRKMKNAWFNVKMGPSNTRTLLMERIIAFSVIMKTVLATLMIYQHALAAK